MNQKSLRVWIFLPAVVFLASACAVDINYKLNPQVAPKSPRPLPLRVQVFNFSDVRPASEREKEARKKEGFKDLGDYTYDRIFRGEVAGEITRALVSHLEYAGVFEKVWQAPVSQGPPDEHELGLLAQRGVSTVMTGEVEHFYGYLDENFMRQILYLAILDVLYIGLTLDAMHRDFDRATLAGLNDVGLKWSLR
ncbi:MAG: hypothetical protein JW747_08875 [Candidatus Aminicenantes bacterium]|nr:hypothetical protein [Candidatus Aminicenantes bacterium]